MKKLPQYGFFRHKYGAELLVDVIDVDSMRADLARTPAYCTTFFSILLFTAGDEPLTVGGATVQGCRGVVACSRPGETWAWQPQTALQGLHLLFEEDFLLSFFRDPLFLSRFSYLKPGRPSPFLRVADGLFDCLCHLLREMRLEINNDRPDKDKHILRAMLYETLMLLNRAPHADAMPAAGVPDLAVMRYVDAFRQLVDAHFREQHDVEFYAAALCITPNYLNRIVRRHLGRSTKQYILGRLLAEAQRQLRYTAASVAEISEALHFDSPAYFVRLFSRHVGCTPGRYRAWGEDRAERPEK